MRDRIAIANVLALASLGWAATVSLAQPAREATPKAERARDDVDKILDEAKENKDVALEHMKAKVEELAKKQDDLLYELINARAKLKRAADGVRQIESGRSGDRPSPERRVEGPTVQGKKPAIRPRPRPKDARERAEILGRLEAEAALVSELHSELISLIKDVENSHPAEKK
jgi:hypothetical protein